MANAVAGSPGTYGDSDIVRLLGSHIDALGMRNPLPGSKSFGDASTPPPRCRSQLLRILPGTPARAPRSVTAGA